MSQPKASKKSTARKTSKAKKTTPVKNKKLEEYAVKFLHSQGKTPEDIAKELSLNADVVSDLVAGEPVAKETTKAQDMMIRHTAEKKNNHVSIMTQEASMLSKDLAEKVTQPRSTKNIFKPKG